MKIPFLNVRALRQDYRTVCESPAGKRMVSDLRRFCLADQPTFIADDPGGRKSAYQEGLRRVYLRIVGMARLSEGEIEAITQQITEDSEGLEL